MQTFWVYPIYTSILGIILKAIVPRTAIKRFAIYSIILGGIGDFIILLILKYIFNIGLYVNYFPFGTSGFPFFPPLAWSIWFILYFYFLPNERFLKIIYIVIAAAYSAFFANVLLNLNIIKWNYERIFLPFGIYLVWFSIVTWIKIKMERAFSN
ncbi:hypothetical protein [Sporohalobacter salinus]|uniref:hypothetical protein n=1 Tax=Sporohalobacter salinus TaxID=1494606 RepID=UPI00195F51A0|nr:hypothetical protein [Sporohalobacter salinus]MBM7624220.1 hypothetical protein [Sporohalobacter salinus]